MGSSARYDFSDLAVIDENKVKSICLKQEAMMVAGILGSISS